MKKIIALALAALLCVGALAGCGGGSSSEESAGSDQLEQIKSKGSITIAMEGTWSPWTYHDENTDELVGFDVEVGQYIAEYLGVEAEFVEIPWDGLFAGMDSGRYDLVINGVDVTEDRSEKYDFSDPSNSIGSTYMELAEQYGATCEGVDSLGETMQMVESGRVEATLNAEQSILDYFSQHPEAQLKIVAYTPDANEIAIPMRKGDDTAALRQAVNEAIAAMREDGTLSELSIKYFGGDITNNG